MTRALSHLYDHTLRHHPHLLRGKTRLAPNRPPHVPTPPLTPLPRPRPLAGARASCSPSSIAQRRPDHTPSYVSSPRSRACALQSRSSSVRPSRRAPSSRSASRLAAPHWVDTAATQQEQLQLQHQADTLERNHPVLMCVCLCYSVCHCTVLQCMYSVCSKMCGGCGVVFRRRPAPQGDGSHR